VRRDGHLLLPALVSRAELARARGPLVRLGQARPACDRARGTAPHAALDTVCALFGVERRGQAAAAEEVHTDHTRAFNAWNKVRRSWVGSAAPEVVSLAAPY
jgi:hypothetical protein